MHLLELMTLVEKEKETVVRIKEQAATKESELEKCIAEERQSHLTNLHRLAQQNSELKDNIKVSMIE